MANLMVIGALALDRPVRLAGPLVPGARLLGLTLDGALAGRLGGGGANAAVALARAGHQVGLCSFVADDLDGQAARAAAQAAGVDTSQVQLRPGVSRTTLILVDAGGERVVLGLDFTPTALPELAPPPEGEVLDGLFVRTAFPGAEAWARACCGPVVAHWPAGSFEGPCDVLVTSADDCGDDFLADPLAAGRARLGERLAWAVVTHGAGPVTAHGEGRTVRVSPPPAKVIDATGAGDVFAAGLLDALASRADMEPALFHACAWGATTVGLDSSAPLTGAFASFRPDAP